jgi:hypothetical protein
LKQVNDERASPQQLNSGSLKIRVGKISAG